MKNHFLLQAVGAAFILTSSLYADSHRYHHHDCFLCPSGPVGPQGIQGDQGPTGTGLPGTPGVSDYFYVYNATPQELETSGNVAFGSAGLVSTANFVPSVDGTSVTMATAGVYRMDFVTLGAIAMTTDAPVTIAVNVNGVDTGPTYSFVTSQTLSFTVTLNLNAGDVVSLTYAQTEATTLTNSSLSILKLRG